MGPSLLCVSGRTVTHWSLAVNLSLGPHSGGCATCSGVVTVDVPEDGSAYTVRRNNEYYTLGHFAAFIPPTSVKLAVQQSGGGGGWQGLAAQTPDGGRVVELLNNGDSAVELAVVDSASGGCFVATVQPKSLSTFVWADSSRGGGGGVSSGVGSGGVESSSSSSGMVGQSNGAFADGARVGALVVMSVVSLLALWCL